jgi:hypothetical protein
MVPSIRILPCVADWGNVWPRHVLWGRTVGDSKANAFYTVRTRRSRSDRCWRTEFSDPNSVPAPS